MPVTKSEMMFFAAGAAVGAAAGANFPLLKEKFGPILAAALAGASSAVGDSYAEVAKHVAEKVEAVQDAMAEMKHCAANNGTAGGPSGLASPSIDSSHLSPRRETTSIHGSCHPFSGPGANSPGEPLPVRGARRSELPPIRGAGVPGPGDHPGHDQESGWLQRGSPGGAGFLS